MKSYLLKIRGGVEVDSQGKKAGKGALVAEEISNTLGTHQDQYLFQPITFEPGIAAREGGHIYEGVSGTLRSNAGDNQMNVAYCVENHPADSRVKLDDSGKVQTLTGRMGTGGGNVPLVMFSKVRRAQSKDDYESWKQSEVTNTLNTFDNGDVRATDIVCCDSVERHAVAYSIGNGQVHDAMSPSKEVCKTLNCMDDPMKVMVAYATGNGQACNMRLTDKFGALDCMHDQKCVVIKRSTEKLDEE